MLRYMLSIVFAATLTAAETTAAPKASPTTRPAPKTVAKPSPAPAKKAPSKAPSASKPLTATAKSVSGIAEKLVTDRKNPKWTPLKAGDLLSERTVIRTGFGAVVVLKFADRGDVTVKSGTKVGISSFRKSGGLVKTEIGLKYGALRANVDSSRGANDFRIRTAVATLAAKGTSGDVAVWGDFSFQCQGTGGSWRSRTPRRVVLVRRGEWSNRRATSPIKLAVAKLTPRIGDIHGGLTKIEVIQLQRNPTPIPTDTLKGRQAFIGTRRFRLRPVIKKLIKKQSHAGT